MTIINSVKIYRAIKKRLGNTLKHIIARGSIIFINQFTLLIALPILASRLDFLTFGKVAIGLMTIQISWLISHWGIHNYSIENWQHLKNKSQKNQLITMAGIVGVVNGIIFLSFILLINLKGWLNIPISLIVSMMPSILIGGINPIWFFQIKKATQKLILPTFSARMIYLLIILVFIKDNSDAYIFFLAQALGLAIVCFYAFSVIKKKYRHKITYFNLNELKNFYLKNTPYFFNSISNNKINTLWGSGLALIGGPGAMALYNLGDEIYRFGSSISNIIAQAIRINFLNNKMHNLKVVNTIFTIFYFTLAILISSVVDPAIKHFFSSNYEGASSIIKIMVFAWAINATVKLINYPVLGRLYGIEWLNKITYQIFLLHIVMFVFWAMVFDSALSFAVFFTSVNLIQLILYYFFYITYNPSNPYRDKNIIKRRNYWGEK